MTHDEVRGLLAEYAAARLGEEDAVGVRRHLASGCRACLDVVFDLPAGVPLPQLPVPPEPGPPDAVPAPFLVAWAPTRPPPRRPVAQGRRLLVIAGIASAVFIGATLADLRERAIVQRREAARLGTRLARSEGERDTLARALATAEAERLREHDTAHAATLDREQLQRDLDASAGRAAALAQTVRRRDAEIARRTTATDGTLQDLLSAPGVQLMPLSPVPPFHDPRGHVLWHPDRDTVLVFASGLLPGRRYRVEVAGEGGLLAAAQALPSGRHGEAAIPLHLRDPAVRLRALEVVLDPPGEAVLSGRRG